MLLVKVICIVSVCYNTLLFVDSGKFVLVTTTSDRFFGMLGFSLVSFSLLEYRLKSPCSLNSSFSSRCKSNVYCLFRLVEYIDDRLCVTFMISNDDMRPLPVY